MAGAEGALHTLAVVLGVVGALFIAVFLIQYFNVATSAELDGITEAESELYGLLAVVGAAISEFAAREA